jgi:hypothetical protein
MRKTMHLFKKLTARFCLVTELPAGRWFPIGMRPAGSGGTGIQQASDYRN